MLAALARFAACAGAGTLLFLSCANFDVWPLAWLGMVPLLFVVLDPRCTRPFLWGWVCGLFANGGGFYWIIGMLERFGHMPFIAAAPLFLLLIAYQALAFGLFARVLRSLADATPLPVTLLAPVAMTAIELVMPFMFPWYLAITQAWVRPVIQIADLTGPLGVTFLIVLANGALFELARALYQKKTLPWRRAAWAAGAIALALGYGQVRIHQVEARRAAAPKLKVGVVQANIGIHEKFSPRLAVQQLDLHQQLSADLERRGAQLIVWPESSYPFAIERGQTHDFDDRRRAQSGFQAPLLYGALTFGGGSPYPYNTALQLDRQGNIVASFDKNFLLVFGEYIPFYEHIPWFRQLIPESSNFARGDTVTTFPVAGYRVAPMICYEDIIPAFARRLVKLRPNLLVNITNDAWFGATSEPWEHLALSVYRAVEHRLDLVRSVNTGVSAFIDATGRVVEKGPAVDPGITANPPPYTLLAEAAMLDASGPYGTLGDTFGALDLAALLALGAWARRRSGRPVRWPLAGAGAFAYAIAALGLAALGAALVDGGRLGLALALIARRPIATSDGGPAFKLGAFLILGLGIAALALGWGVARAARQAKGLPPRLEAAIAALAIVLAPALAVGRLEGETAGVVFASVGAIGLALAGVRLFAWRNPEPAAAPPAPAKPEPPGEGAIEKAEPPRKRKKKKR